MAQFWHNFGILLAHFSYKPCYYLIMQNLTYDLFLEKFKREKNTDDCYTPENVYEAVLNWCVDEYGIDKSKILRPFYPDKDYSQIDYPDDCVVLDNPPFSILVEIIQFYLYLNVKFFLFAPHKTIFSLGNYPCCFICTDAKIIFENGANVSCSFVTNLEQAGVRSAPELYKRIKDAQKKEVSLPKYIYPDEVLTFSKVSYLSKYDVDFKADYKKLFFVRVLDNQKQYNKHIFGAGFIMAQDTTKNYLEACNKANKNNETKVWELSDREKKISWTL